MVALGFLNSFLLFCFIINTFVGRKVVQIRNWRSFAISVGAINLFFRMLAIGQHGSVGEKGGGKKKSIITACSYDTYVFVRFSLWVCSEFLKRKERDSNPRTPNGVNGFRDRPDRPLRHLSCRASRCCRDCDCKISYFLPLRKAYWQKL